MRFDYDKKGDMWVFEDMVRNITITIYVTRWAESGKGPMLDFAVFADDEAEYNCYEVEVLTARIKEGVINDYCKEIRDCYSSEDFLEKITKRGSEIFKSHTNGYFREIGHEGRVMQYVKSRNYKVIKTTITYKANCLNLNKKEKPALEYPGSRLDCIAD